MEKVFNKIQIQIPESCFKCYFYNGEDPLDRGFKECMLYKAVVYFENSVKAKFCKAVCVTVEERE